jgi:uncharacterized protein (TIRG00374 family)
MCAGSRKLLLTLIGLAVLAALLYRSRGIIHLPDFSGRRLLDSIRETRLSLLLLSVVAIYACYALRALRWKRFSRHLGPSDFWSVYQMTLAGFAALFLLGRAGEPVRPLLIARKERLPISGMFGIYFLERLFDTASTAAIAALALALFPKFGQGNSSAGSLATASRTTARVLFAGLAVAIGFLVYFRLHGAAFLDRRLGGWRERGGGWAKLAGIVTGFSHGLQAIRTLGDLLMAVVYSAAHWALVALVYLWIAQSFGGKLAMIGFSGAMLVLAFTMLGSTLQLPGVGGGSQVASFLAFTAVFGVEKEPAAAAAIVLWLVTFAACSLPGVPLLIHEGWSIGELRRTAEREESAAEQA